MNPPADPLPRLDPDPRVGRALILAAALGFAARAAAALLLERLARQRGALCLFPDTDAYWGLATAILEGAPFVVRQWDVPHYALRTPTYPAFLAGCRWLLGDATLGPRLVQAALGGLGAALVARIAVLALPRAGVRTAAAAGILAALEPYGVGASVLLLSEGVFIPLMLTAVWCLAEIWRRLPLQPRDDDDPRARNRARPLLPALAVLGGVATGLGVLARPSWALYPPLAVLIWLLWPAPTRESDPRSTRPAPLLRRRAAGLAAIAGLAAALVMAPWWIRNWTIHARFVPTALWMGASLYDGLGPEADGASDMTFLEAPDLRALGEVEQDRELTRRALAAARESPARVLRLALVKAARYWSPRPNFEGLRNPLLDLLSACWTIPLFACGALGLWTRRRDPLAWALLAGPVLYFMAVHLVFVGSVRYRIPGAFPALPLVVAGAAILARRLRALAPAPRSPS